MCGITGFYGVNNRRARSEMHILAQGMAQAIAHRGPDAGGVWQDPVLPLVMAHRRLSILDLSADGAQPMHSHNERFAIVYNGEIYNFLKLRADLEALGVIFKGRSDTEVLLEAVSHWGLNQTLQKIDGMFAFALWDRQERALHFARDRMGKKPLYIGWAGDALVFGSELKALRAHPDFKAVVNREALALYMRNLCVPAPHCIYEGVWNIPAGHRLSLELDALEPARNLQKDMQPFWSAVEKMQNARLHITRKSEALVLREFEDLLGLAVQERMMSDVPLGAFLSGGIDSSAVVALMQKNSERPVKTYTIGFEEAAFNEATYAREVAAHLGTDHHEHFCTAQDALDIIPTLPDMYDEPFADQSAIPTYLVCKFARESVTVALSGDGGDEMLGGYTRHITGPKIWNIMRRIPAPLRQAAAKSMTRLSIEQWQALAKSKPLFGNHMHKAASILSLNSQEEIYSRLTAQWEDLPNLKYRSASLASIGALPELKDLSFAEKIMVWDTLTYLPHDILAKVDRASMATSLEVRAPLLDSRIYEYVWSLPENLKIRNGQGKYLLRQMLHNHVPAKLFERPKQGFNIPLGEWMRGALRGWCEDLLNAQTLADQGFFDAAQIRKIWDEHLAGRGNHANALWSVLMFQAWHKRWME